MIVSFGDSATEALFHGGPHRATRRLPTSIQRAAFRKLDMLNVAVNLNDLRVLPGNRLEALKGDLKGLHSVRINNQWRLTFRWEAGEAHEVMIIDYH